MSAKSAKKPFKLDERLYTMQSSLANSFKEDKGKKFKKLCFICYDCEELELFLATAQPFDWAWICHDKDVTDGGEPKAIHYHCVVRFENGIRLTAFKKAFSGNVFVEVPYNDDACIKYLTHEGIEGKYQYPVDDVQKFTESGQRSFFVSKEEYQNNKNKEFLDDLENKLPRREMALKYGRDYMKNVDRYEQFVGHLERDKIQDAYATLVARLMHTQDDVSVIAGDFALALEYCAKHTIIHVDRFFDVVQMFATNRKNVPTSYGCVNLNDNKDWINPEWTGSWANMELALDIARENAIKRTAELAEQLKEGLKK